MSRKVNSYTNEFKQKVVSICNNEGYPAGRDYFLENYKNEPGVRHEIQEDSAYILVFGWTKKNNKNPIGGTRRRGRPTKNEQLKHRLEIIPQQLEATLGDIKEAEKEFGNMIKVAHRKTQPLVTELGRLVKQYNIVLD